MAKQESQRRRRRVEGEFGRREALRAPAEEERERGGGGAGEEGWGQLGTGGPNRNSAGAEKAPLGGRGQA